MWVMALLVGFAGFWKRTVQIECHLSCPRPMGHFGIARSVRLSVPWRSCLGNRHAGCLQLSHRRPPEMCGLRTRPPTDVDPPRFLPPSNCHRRGHIVSPSPGTMPCRFSKASFTSQGQTELNFTALNWSSRTGFPCKQPRWNTRTRRIQN